MNLFQTGNYNLHSGASSDFKIDCDALTDEDIETVAAQLAVRLPIFRAVEGVPQGGLRLAAAMEKYTLTRENGYYKDLGYPLLIVDDVYTTGGSMREHRAGREAIGAVIFARTEPPNWIVPLFRLTP